MTEAFGTTFSSPVLLAAGTCGFGEPLVEFMSPSEVGGLVTKSVTVEPRWGNPPPRVAEFADGMLNSVGLANPGVEAVRSERLPWIRRTLGGLPVFVSVAGSAPDEYAAVVSGLDGEDGFLGFELNLSCPNDSRLRGGASASGLPFGLDLEALAHLVELVRPLTERPLIVKLAPNDPEIARSASRAVDCGADGVTAVNTMPGTLPLGGDGSRLGAGSGGMSGPALLPTALGAVARVAAAVGVPVLGVGGILSARDARAFLDAGATMIQIGTASFADPRSAAVVARGLAGLT